ncbi:MAG: hypothetical protein COT15_02900 [Candidatus Diapherotrites archaeon CG08_land_8_20_14_0_20_34_12]|nr:MAG: hypothetical protein COT15_02900 [Candidatus Diapherotrites archaeon CG08_land_8_20_14_0_20_34_12]
MNSLNCAIFNENLAKEFGKKEHDSDIEFYHRIHNNRVLTFIYPKGFPEKINSLLQALHLSNYVLLQVDKIDAALGEIIVAIDSLGKKDGFLIIGDAVDENIFNKIIENSAVKNYQKISKEDVLETLSNADLKQKTGQAVIDLDSLFDVKGVGTVALGFLTHGNILKMSNIKALPNNIEVFIKTIQKQDKDWPDAYCNDRVGLAIKGLTVEDFSRGIIFTLDPEFKASKTINIQFEKNKFCKKDLAQNQQLHLQCRLQIVGCIVKQLNPLSLELSKEIAFKKGEQIALIDINGKPRIIGKGTIL